MPGPSTEYVSAFYGSPIAHDDKPPPVVGSEVTIRLCRYRVERIEEGHQRFGRAAVHVYLKWTGYAKPDPPKGSSQPDSEPK